MKNERLLWTLLVLGVIVIGITAYCNKPYEFKVSRTPYKEKISPIKAYLDTAKLLTYVYEDSFFVVQYRMTNTGIHIQVQTPLLPCEKPTPTILSR